MERRPAMFCREHLEEMLGHAPEEQPVFTGPEDSGHRRRPAAPDAGPMLQADESAADGSDYPVGGLRCSDATSD